MACQAVNLLQQIVSRETSPLDSAVVTVGTISGGSMRNIIAPDCTIGGTFRVTPKALVALDYQRINYGGVRSISNPSTNMAPIGSSDGPGFGC